MLLCVGCNQKVWPRFKVSPSDSRISNDSDLGCIFPHQMIQWSKIPHFFSAPRFLDCSCFQMQLSWQLSLTIKVMVVFSQHPIFLACRTWYPVGFHQGCVWFCYWNVQASTFHIYNDMFPNIFHPSLTWYTKISVQNHSEAFQAVGMKINILANTVFFLTTHRSVPVHLIMSFEYHACHTRCLSVPQHLCPSCPFKDIISPWLIIYLGH